MMKDVDKFWGWVETRISELKIKSWRQFEKRAGYAPGAIGKRRNNREFPTVEMAEGMCRALQISWTELWFNAGFIMQSVDDSELDRDITLRQILDVAKDLSYEEREELLAYAILRRDRQKKKRD